MYSPRIAVQKPGPQYSPAIYTMDVACKIDLNHCICLIEYISQYLVYNKFNKYEVDQINIISLQCYVVYIPL